MISHIEVLKSHSVNYKLDKSSSQNHRVEIMIDELKSKISKSFSSKSNTSISSFISVFENLCVQHMKRVNLKILNEGFLTNLLKRILQEGVLKWELLEFALEYHYTSFKKLKEAVWVAFPESKSFKFVENKEPDTDLSMKLMWILAVKFIDLLKRVQHPKNMKKIKNIIDHHISNFVSNKLYGEDYRRLILFDS